MIPGTPTWPTASPTTSRQTFPTSPEAFVIARETAYTYRGKATDVRQIGRELGVRYVLEGSVRRIDATLKVNAQLISAETGAHLWSDRFDEEISELGAGQEQVVTRMRAGLGISMVEIENARSLRERPTNPDAFDLILRARSLENLPPNLQRNDEALSLYERALSLDPTSAYAMRMMAIRLINKSYPSWETAENMQRVETLVTQARAIAPDAEGLLGLMIQWYRKLERNQEAMAVAEDLIRRFPNNFLRLFCPLDEQGLCRTCGGSHSIAGESDPAQPAQFLSVLSLPPIGLRLAAAGKGQRCDYLPGTIARNQPGRRWRSSMDLPLPCRSLCTSWGVGGGKARGRRSGPSLALRHRSQSLAGRPVEPRLCRAGQASSGWTASRGRA